MITQTCHVVGSATAGCTPGRRRCSSRPPRRCRVKVRVVVDGKKPVNAASMLGVLSLGAGQGTSVTLEADDDGPEAAEAVDASLVDLLEPRPRRGGARGRRQMTLTVRCTASASAPVSPSGRCTRWAGHPSCPRRVRSTTTTPKPSSPPTALDTVSADLAATLARSHRPTASAVLDALSMIAADPTLQRTGRRADPLAHRRRRTPCTGRSRATARCSPTPAATSPSGPPISPTSAIA